MKIWTISDTHRQHYSLKIPENIDVVIHAGDSTNYYNWYENQPEFEDFLSWFSNLPIKHKVLIAGNHDAWATKKYNVDKVKELGIKYLEHEYLELEGKILFGSPYTPNFGTWHFMKDRSKLNQYWEVLTENIDILITHGPPKGILDLSHNMNHQLEYCGDSALFKHILRIKPKYHIFGHIHDSEGCYNSGVLKLSSVETTFINASCVTDGKFNQGTTSNGYVFEIKRQLKITLGKH